jgi:hypothetical protein
MCMIPIKKFWKLGAGHGSAQPSNGSAHVQDVPERPLIKSTTSPPRK